MSEAKNSVDLNRIQMFQLVLELGSFSKAAKKLGVPKSNISRNISDLEAQLKTQLIYRTTRQFQPTDAGRQLYAGSREALLKIGETVAKLTSSKEEIRGRIRCTAPEDLGALMAPLVAKFLKLHPNVQIDLHLTNEILRPVQDGFDISVRAGEVTDASLIVRTLGTSDIGLVASAEFAARFSELFSIESIHEVPCVSFLPLGDPNEWNLISKQKKKKVSVKPVCIVNSPNAVLALANLGVGVAPIPLALCNKELVNGDLVRVLPEWSFPSVTLQIVMPPRKEKNASISAFSNYTVQYFKNVFVWSSK